MSILHVVAPKVDWPWSYIVQLLDHLDWPGAVDELSQAVKFLREGGASKVRCGDVLPLGRCIAYHAASW